MVIGFDFRGFAALAERRLGIPVFGFPATGLGYYDKGQRDAYLAIAGRLLKDDSAKNPRRVNILGASSLDGFDDTTLDMLEGLLKDAGLQTGAIWGRRSGIEELAESGGAGANWALTAAALPLARHLQSRYGTPFAAGLPLGKQETSRILSALKAYTAGKSAGDKNSNAIPPSGMGGEARALIAGEALFCASLRACLEREYDYGPVQTGSFFGEGKELLGSGDRFFACEDDAEQAFTAPGLKRIIADPLMKGLVPGSPSLEFIPMPHRAVSGRIYEESQSLRKIEHVLKQIKPLKAAV
jgi:hypothetical protein